VIRRDTSYLTLATKRPRFLDISNYLASGFSYNRYLHALGCSVSKGVFPYEWMDNLSKLDHMIFPPYETFYSELKGCIISTEEYFEAWNTWRHLGMTTFRDYMKWYNNRDVEPFVEAVDKQIRFFASKGLDMLKDWYSVPGLTLRYLFQLLPAGVYFSLYGNESKKLHDLIKANLVGGLSVVFHRYHERGRTYLCLRPPQFGQLPLCKKVLGFDANALYLFSLMQPMPTGRIILRKCGTTFQAERMQTYGYMARQWL